MTNGHATDSGLRFQITGGAGPYEAAAIAAVIEHSLAEERKVAGPPARRFSNWMMVAVGEPFVPPRPIANGALNGAARSSALRPSRLSKS